MEIDSDDKLSVSDFHFICGKTIVAAQNFGAPLRTGPIRPYLTHRPEHEMATWQVSPSTFHEIPIHQPSRSVGILPASDIGVGSEVPASSPDTNFSEPSCFGGAVRQSNYVNIDIIFFLH